MTQPPAPPLSGTTVPSTPPVTDTAEAASARRDLYELSDLEALVPELMKWIAEYWTQPRTRSVYQPGPPGHVLSQLSSEIPLQGEGLQTIFQDFQTIIAPGLLHWNHPGFFGFFPCNTSGPSVAAALLASAIDVNPFSWNAGPAAVELEMRVLEWLSNALGLGWRGVLQDTASSATLGALVAARERALNRIHQESNTGAALGRLVAYVSTEAHSSVAKGAFVAGLARHQIRTIGTTTELALDPEALKMALRQDVAAGLLPFFVCTSLGTTSTTAFDDPAAVQDIIDRLLQEGVLEQPLWHHVDAALAGSAALLPEMSWMMKGVERADSFVFNPHKWLFTNFECSALFVKDPQSYKAALSADPEYLKNPTVSAGGAGEAVEVEDFRNWSITLGRGFRGLKLWFVLRAYGLEKLRTMIRSHLAMTQDLYRRILESQRSTTSKDVRGTLSNQGHASPSEDAELRYPDFVTLVPPRLNTICLRLGDESMTRRLLEILLSRGRIYLTPTRVNGTFWLRIALGQTALLPQDIDHLWEELQTCGREAMRSSADALGP